MEEIEKFLGPFDDKKLNFTREEVKEIIRERDKINNKETISVLFISLLSVGITIFIIFMFLTLK